MIPRRGETYRHEDVDAVIEEGIVESERLDYKADPHLWPDPRIDPVNKLQSLVVKAATAFANSGNGTLLLGIE